MKYFILYLLSCVTIFSTAAQNLSVISLPVQTSIRGMAVVDAQTIWISGSNGYVGVTHDAGNTWQMQQVPDYDSAEFRDIEVFPDGSILLMSSTAPAAILRSSDQGKTWEQMFRSDDPAYFLDAMDFYGDRGMCLGDPVKGHFLTLYTENGGKYWEERWLPDATDSLAAFAASGSVVQYLSKKRIVFSTGGKQALLYYTNDGGISWQFTGTDISAGTPSAGIFAMSVCDRRYLIVAGGNYLMPATEGTNLETLHYRSKQWWLLEGAELDVQKSSTFGYISGIACAKNNSIVICGTGGVGLIHSGYTKISETGFHVATLSPDQKTCFLAGNNVFGILSLPVTR